MVEESGPSVISRESALHGQWVAGQYGKVGPPGVTMQQVIDLNLFQISAWPDTAGRVRRQMGLAAGVQQDEAPQPGAPLAMEGDRGYLLPVEPLKWWLLHADTVQLNPDEGFVLDQSHAYTCLRISGTHAATLLNRHLSLDLREEHCTVNSVQSSSFDHVGVTLWRRPQGFDLFLPRSFAASLFNLLCESAEQFGYELLDTTAQQ